MSKHDINELARSISWVLAFVAGACMVWKVIEVVQKYL